MPYCPNCGSLVNTGDRFCANCGTAIQAFGTTTVTSVNPAARTDYRIVLVSRGTCSRAVAIDMISDLLGYTDADAARIIDNAPMETAVGLTAIQAQYISQAISEYGMQVAIYNNDGYVDMGSKATSSVYNSDGSFLSAVAGVLTGLTLSNRVSTFNRWTRPAPLLFNPVYRRPAPPPMVRRRRLTPRPGPNPFARPVPPPAPPRSVASSRPAPVPPPPPPRPVGPVATPPRPAPGPNIPGAGRGGRGPGGMPGPGGGRRGF